MRIPSWPAFVAACAIALCAAGCATSRSDAGTDSTTHWLESCERDDDCGGLSCLCGTCSTECGSDDACAGFGREARCGRPSASCSEVASMCVAADAQPVGEGGTSPERAIAKDGSRDAIDAAGAAVPAGGSGAQAEVDAGVASCTGVGFLKGGGRSHQPCVDDCRLELNLTPVGPDDRGPCEGELEATLSVQMIEDGYRERTAKLTAAAWDQFVGVSSELSKTGPSAGFCPGCGDGDQAWVTVPGIDQFDSTRNYALGSPPAALVESDAFVQALVDQLDACSGPLIASCEDTTPAVNPDDPGEPWCQIVYTAADGNAAATCSFAPDIADPCRAAVSCLCGTEGLLPGAWSGAQACQDDWLIPRGAITFTDFCSDDAASATRTVGEAVIGLATAYGDSATATPECDALPAYY